MRLPLFFLMLFGSVRVLPSSYQLVSKFSSLSLSLAWAVAPSNTVSASDGKNRRGGVRAWGGS